MTSTSKTCQIRCREAIHGRDDVDQAVALIIEAVSPADHANALENGGDTQTLRMKAFASPRQFQAPVADDFTRGMLAPGHPGHSDTRSKHAGETWAARVKGFITWWHGQKSN